MSVWQLTKKGGRDQEHAALPGREFKALAGMEESKIFAA